MDGTAHVKSMPNFLAVKKACDTLSCSSVGIIYACCRKGFIPPYVPVLLDDEAIFRSIHVHCFQGTRWSLVTRSLRNFRSVAYFQVRREGVLRPPSASGASNML